MAELCSLVDDGALQHLIYHVLFIDVVILGAKHRHSLSPLAAAKTYFL